MDCTSHPKNSAPEKLAHHLGMFEVENTQKRRQVLNMQQFFADLLRTPAKTEGATDGGGQA